MSWLRFAKSSFIIHHSSLLNRRGLTRRSRDRGRRYTATSVTSQIGREFMAGRFVILTAQRARIGIRLSVDDRQAEQYHTGLSAGR
jgi:hypothetical protein